VIAYLLYTNVFSPSSTTRHFQRASSRVQRSPECRRLLGEGVVAYGNSRWSSFARARMKAPPGATMRETIDPKTGVRTVRLRFLVRGERAQGWVSARLVKESADGGYVFELLTLDVEGQPRVYLEGKPERIRGNSDGKIFGIKWR
jgi:import inner membrane translocase subunit TIM21